MANASFPPQSNHSSRPFSSNPPLISPSSLPPDPPPPLPPLSTHPATSDSSNLLPVSQSAPQVNQSWSSLFKKLPRNAGSYKPVHMDLNFADGALVPPSDVISAGEDIWGSYLVGFFLDKPLSYTYVIEFLKRLWRLQGSVHVKSDGGVFLFQLSDQSDKERIIRGDPIVMKNKLFIIKQWDSMTSNVCGAVLAVPIWVKFSNIPIFSWSLLGINWIASRLGKLICLDKSTQSLSRIQYAKCLIEITPQNELVDSFPILYPDGSKQIIYVTYLWKPEICVKCKAFGHNIMSCQFCSSDPEVLSEDKAKNVSNGEIKTSLPGNTNESSQKAKNLEKEWKMSEKAKGRRVNRGAEGKSLATSTAVTGAGKIWNNGAIMLSKNGNKSSRQGRSKNINSFSVLDSINEDSKFENEVSKDSDKSSDMQNEKVADTQTGVDGGNSNNDQQINDSAVIMQSSVHMEKVSTAGDKSSDGIGGDHSRMQVEMCTDMCTLNSSDYGHTPESHAQFITTASYLNESPVVQIVNAKKKHNVIASPLLPSPDPQQGILISGKELECSVNSCLLPISIDSSILHIGAHNIFSSPSPKSKIISNEITPRPETDVAIPLLATENSKSVKKKKLAISLGNTKDKEKKRLIRGNKRLMSTNLSSIDSENDDLTDYIPDNSPITSKGRSTRLRKTKQANN